MGVLEPLFWNILGSFGVYMVFSKRLFWGIYMGTLKRPFRILYGCFKVADLVYLCPF